MCGPQRAPRTLRVRDLYTRAAKLWCLMMDDTEEPMELGATAAASTTADNGVTKVEEKKATDATPKSAQEVPW